jgi:hypothetical protein
MFNVISSVTHTVMATCSDYAKAQLVCDSLNKTTPWDDSKFEIVRVVQPFDIVL